MLAADDVITVGRVLSSWSAADIQNNQEKITYTVYNQQASEATGVLLTATLQPGATFQSASQLPDRSGQELVWSLGTIPAFGRASVDVIVTFPGAIPLQLDDGAAAFATVDAAAVTDTAPPATLRAAHIDPALIAATPDANSTDPFIQAKAAQLDYDPKQFFQFLAQEVSYESYAGSLRGARGTLWSSAGNSLDEASLGLALFRSSGIPSQYAQGTLADVTAQELIVSMFPESHRVVGSIPAGTATADPTHDPLLLAETRVHYWVQFDSGSGLQNLDATSASIQLGQILATPTNTFSEIPDVLRHKTTVRLNAEITNLATGLFGLPGQFVTTVLETSFTDAELVGRPLTLGHFVTSSPLVTPVITAVTNTYSPYLRVGDEAFDLSGDRLIRDQDYQEVLTNFPFGSQILTGLFLEIDLQTPGGTTETVSRVLLDRIGLDIRQHGGSPSINIDPNSATAVTPLDVFTISVMPAGRELSSIAAPGVASDDVTTFASFVEKFNAATPEEQESLASEANQRFENFLVGLQRSSIAEFEARATAAIHSLAQTHQLRAYLATPRITIASSHVEAVDGTTGQIRLSLDLRKSSYRAVVSPGQAVAAAVAFQFLRGMLESEIEGRLLSPNGGSDLAAVASPIYTAQIIRAADEQDIELAALRPGDDSQLALLPYSAEAKARIADALASGKSVIAPNQAVQINGKQVLGWFEVNEATGETAGILEDGTHGAGTTETALLYGYRLRQFNDPAVQFSLGFIAGFTRTGLLKTFALIAAGFLFQSAPEPWSTLAGTASNLKNLLGAAKTIVESWLARDTAMQFILTKVHPFFRVGFEIGTFAAINLTADPPVPPALVDPQPFDSDSETSTTLMVGSSAAAGAVSGTVIVPQVAVRGDIAATWTSNSSSSYEATKIVATDAEVRDFNGALLGMGSIELLAGGPIGVSVSGTLQQEIHGTGSLSFYAPATSNLGVGGEWDSFSATVTGNVTLDLSTNRLVLNGNRLPSGAYSITASRVALDGKGDSGAPNFSGTAAMNVGSGTVYLSPGSGSLGVGGDSADLSQGVTLSGYSGNVTVTAGAALDTVTLSASAAKVLRIAASPANVATDQNTPLVISPVIGTSLAGEYRLVGRTPEGWSLSIDAAGQATIVPKPGVQSGTYAVHFIVRSTSDLTFVAQSAVNVTVTSTQPGITLDVQPDSLLYVSANGAQAPTVFRASIHNSGPAPDTFDITFGPAPAGFSILGSVSRVSIPAGETAIVGVNLQPTGSLPAPGSPSSFEISARSATNPAVVATKTQGFVVPVIHGVVLQADRTEIGTTPAVPVDFAVAVESRGNVSENVAFTSLASAGLTVTGLQGVTLNSGERRVITVTLTPAATVPLNSSLTATITASFGGLENVVLPVGVRVAVPGADAIANTATAALQLGNLDLANRLNDLSIALTNFFQDPDSDVFRSQVGTALEAVIRLLGADQFLANLIPELIADRDQLDQAFTPQEVQAAAIALGDDLEAVGNILANEAKFGFTLAFVNNSQVGTPQVPATYQVVLQNTGSQTATYDLSTLGGLPSGVTTSISPTTITLMPGQVSPGSPGVPDIFVTITSNSTTQVAPFSFQVQATVQGAPEITQTATGQFTPRGELVEVVSVTATPPFTNAGGLVNISANILNAVNQQQSANVTYTITDSQSSVVYSLPQPVTTTLNVLTTLTTVNLGQFNTTGLANGVYTITVTVNGETGTGTLLVGTPITASLTTTPTTPPAGTSTVTTTLQLNSQTPFNAPFSLLGQQAVGGSNGVAVSGNLAYVGTGGGIHVVNVADPAHPQDLSTFGASDIPGGSTVQLQVYQDKLVVVAFTFAGTQNKLLVYSLATPATPTLIGQTPIRLPGDANATGILFALSGVADDLVVTSAIWYRYFVFNGQIFGQFGQNIVIDISDPTTPTIKSVIYNEPPDPTHVYPDGTSWPDGSSNIWQAVAADSHTLLVATTTATRDVYSGPTVKGLVMVVDTTDPAAPNVLQKLVIPNTAVITGISVQGNRALVIGSTEYWGGGTTGITGNVVTAMLDLANPQAPTVLSSDITNVKSIGMGGLLSLGTSQFVTNSVAGPNFAPELLVFNTSDAENVAVAQQIIPQNANYFATAGGLLFTTDNSNLLIYQIGQTPSIPIFAEVTVPTSGVTINPNSFSLAPTKTTNNPNSQTFEWDLSFAAGTTSQTITWQSSVPGLQPGESRAVAQAASVDFVSQSTPGHIDLPDQIVAGQQIIGISPATQVIAPGASATYTVTLKNPSSSQVSYSLAVQGVDSTWVELDSPIFVAAGQTVNVPLKLNTSAADALEEYGFSVVASGNNGAVGSVQAELALQGQPIAPDAEAHGVLVDLVPFGLTAGQGDTVSTVARITNTGSAAEAFHLTTPNPLNGFVITFSQTDVEVPPGAANYRDVPLTITVPASVPVQSYNFRVAATSTANAGVTDTETGFISVRNLGVDIDILSSTASPGSTLQLLVTNAGTTADTYDLSLGGPAGLVSTLSTPSVTLAVGASQQVTIQIGQIDFATPGALLLSATANSRTNTAITDTDTAAVNITGFKEMNAAFTPATQQLTTPGTATFVLNVNNTGNLEDAYSATIVGENGPVSASLVGLDGQPTDSIDTFRLPGLSTGAILLNAALSSLGQGVVNVQIRSLTDGSIVANTTATVVTVLPWHNYAKPLDVRGGNGIEPDGSVDAGDALAIINYINAFGAGPIPENAEIGLPFGFLDTSGGPGDLGDNQVVPGDALMVINAINAALGGEGEPTERQDESSHAASKEAQPLSSSSQFTMNELIGLLALDVASQPKRRR